MENDIQLLGIYKSLERKEHIVIDDVISKVLQEVSELFAEIQSENKEDMFSEAGDVLINIVSVAQELWCNIQDIFELQKTPISEDMLWMIAAWNTRIQSLRWRYSRNEVSLEEVESSTKVFISHILNYTDPWKNIWALIETNLQKLMQREWTYKPDIIIKDYIAEYQDFPKAGINFKDISPILSNPEALRYVCHEMAEKCRWADKIVALDARGFIFTPLIGQILWIPFVMARKPGKLPGETESISYDLEYGSNTIEIQKWAIRSWEKIAIVDDLLATGGTAMAAIELVEKLWWVIHNAAFVIWLDEVFLLDQENRKQLWKYNISTIVSYGDE